MAMYLVLQFDDDAAARSCAELYEELAVKMVKKPTLFCECTSGFGMRGGSGWTRGTKYGWWVHSQCGKPSAYSKRKTPEELASIVICQGKNLMETASTTSEKASPDTSMADTSNTSSAPSVVTSQ